MYHDATQGRRKNPGRRSRAEGAMLTPPEAAAFLRVSPETVIRWIVDGILAGMNVAKQGSLRPRYRIRPDDLDAFLSKRAVVPPPKSVRQPRRDPDVISFV